MLSVSDAFTLMQQHVLSLPTETVPLDNATGRVLREAIKADRDFPPFDRVAMDGIGIQFADYSAGQRTFRVVGTQRAGEPQRTLTESTVCLEVMTGAMLPIGVDTVVRYEDVTIADGQATITIEDVERGQNIHAQATDRKAGEELLPIGTWMGPSQMAVAASVGQTQLLVTTLPRVALISTGDELVAVDETPLPYQIRRSNTYMVQTVLLSLGINATMHHINDDEAILETEIAQLLANNDVLILSGGVSAGKADFVPAVLTRLGVQQRFHKIAQKPGKPLWFGTTENKTVFGLPGNPVSTVLCACRYVLPYLRVALGLAPTPVQYARLAIRLVFRPELTYFLPVQLTSEPDGRTLAHSLPGSGSADFANLTAADGFMELPATQSEFEAGDVFQVWSLPSVR